MRRKLFSFAGALSLLLCFAVVMMWARSYWRCDEFEWAGGSVISSRGLVFYGPGTFVGRPGFHRLELFYEPARFTGPIYVYFHFEGFAFARGGGTVLHVAVPYWGMAMLMGLPFGLELLPALRNRPKHRVCESCGYNLTGNVSGVCPECGMAVDPQVVQVKQALYFEPGKPHVVGSDIDATGRQAIRQRGIRADGGEVRAAGSSVLSRRRGRREDRRK